MPASTDRNVRALHKKLLLYYYQINVARCFSFVSLNSSKDRFFFPPVSSRTFIFLLFARSFPHLGQNLNETCKDSPHVEKSRRKKEELRNRSFFSANTWGPGANVL